MNRNTVGRARTIIWRIAYWLFLLWLLIWFSLDASEVAVFLADSETYRRVYRDPEFYFAVVAGFALLHAIALALHGAGWRTHRFSVTAIAIAILNAGFLILNVTVGVFVTCCS